MDYQKLAADILKLVGGDNNVASVTNCMTRLRFNLKETGRADVDGLKKTKGRTGCSDQERSISSCNWHGCG